MAHVSQASLSPLLQLKARAMVRVHPFWSLKTVTAIALVSSLGLASCSTNETSAANADSRRPNIIATTTIIADLTETIAGDTITLTSLLSPGEDPHLHKLSPDDVAMIERADLVLYNGLNLEPAVIQLLNAPGADIPRLPVAEMADVLEMDQAKQQQPDPHIWGDVHNGIAMVNVIRDALIELSPDHQAQFIGNAQALNTQLVALDTWVYRQVETIPQDRRSLVTTHDAFQYYGIAYDLETPSSAAQDAELTPVIQSPLYSDSIGPPGSAGDSYFKMMEANTKVIVEALGGSYTPFPGIPMAPDRAN